MVYLLENLEDYGAQVRVEYIEKHYYWIQSPNQCFLDFFSPNEAPD